MNWLVKTEPGDYSAADLERDGTTRWDGVRNAVAQKHLKAMQPGEEVFLYHTGGEKAIVALAKVTAAPAPDPADKSGKRVAVPLAFAGWLQRPVALADVKADPAFEDFELVRIGRLSVMPVPGPLWQKLLRMGGGEA